MITEQKLYLLLEKMMLRGYKYIKRYTPNTHFTNQTKSSPRPHTLQKDLSGDKLHPTNKLYNATILEWSMSKGGGVYIDTSLVSGKNAKTGQTEMYYTRVMENLLTDYGLPNLNRKYWDNHAKTIILEMMSKLRPYATDKNNIGKVSRYSVMSKIDEEINLSQKFNKTEYKYNMKQEYITGDDEGEEIL